MKRLCLAQGTALCHLLIWRKLELHLQITLPMGMPCPQCQQATRIRRTEKTELTLHRFLVCTQCKFKFRTIEQYYLVRPDAAFRAKPGTQKFCGANNHNAVLTEPDVARLRQLARDGATSKELAKTFGVSQSHINRILRYRSWKQCQQFKSSAQTAQVTKRML